MKGRTIRFGERMLEMVQEEADREGVSYGAFVREAAFARVILMKARRGEFPEPEAEELMEAVRRYLSASP